LYFIFLGIMGEHCHILVPFSRFVFVKWENGTFFACVCQTAPPPQLGASAGGFQQICMALEKNRVRHCFQLAICSDYFQSGAQLALARLSDGNQALSSCASATLARWKYDAGLQLQRLAYAAAK
jgi:hypothetical protein